MSTDKAVREPAGSPGPPDPSTPAAPSGGSPPPPARGIHATRGSLVHRIASQFDRGDGDAGRLAVFALLILVLALIAPNFISKGNWLATSQSSTEIVFLAIGETFVIITGGIDLSVGAMLGCAAMVGAVVMRDLLSAHGGAFIVLVLGFGAALVAGALMGFVNGLVITKMKITPFIATLGMLGVASGATNLLSGGVDIVAFPPQLATIGNSTLLGGWVTIPVIVAVAAAVIAAVALARTRFGLRTYAIGSNRLAAHRTGLAVDRHLIKVYTLSGLLSALSGILLMARFVDASPLAGADDELAAIAAAVIGGAALTGGRGTILGAMIGTGVTATLETGLILAHVAPFWQTVATGVLIILAVYANQLRAARADL